MKKFTIEEAMQDLEYNQKLAESNPENQAKFLEEFMYSNPNDYEAMKKLYVDYGYKYSQSLWALQQVQFMEADKKDRS